MARDFEDLHDLGDLNDRELRDLVRDQLSQDPALDPDDISVRVQEGRVILEGRVGTESERRIAERIVADVLGVESLDNAIFVDPVRRATSPEAADDHLADVDLREGRLLGDREVPLTSESEHLRENLDEELFGTTDVLHAIEEGTPWIPPEGPTPEGLPESEERGEYGEDH